MGASASGSDGDNAVSTTLFVLVACNFVLLLSKLQPTPMAPDKGMALEPISFIGSRLSVLVMAYLSTSAYVRKHRSLEKLLSRMRWTWRRPAITLAYIELFATASASLLLTLRAFAGATRGVALELAVVSCSLALLSFLGPVLFAYSEIACRLSLVASVVEEDCQGLKALRRAEELVRGRKLQGLVLTMALAIVEHAVLMALGFKDGGCPWNLWSLISCGSILLLTKFLTLLVYTAFYFECKKFHGKKVEDIKLTQ